MSDEANRTPIPGADGAPDSTSDPNGGEVEVDEHAHTVTRKEESGVGPGAGAGPIVKVTAPVQREDETPTKHPTLRDENEEQNASHSH